MLQCYSKHSIYSLSQKVVQVHFEKVANILEYVLCHEVEYVLCHKDDPCIQKIYMH